MKKLKVQQRRILDNAKASQQASGVKKPITVCTKYRETGLEGYSKNFSKYCKDMWDLLDRGLIAEARDGFAYVV